MEVISVEDVVKFLLGLDNDLAQNIISAKTDSEFSIYNNKLMTQLYWNLGTFLIEGEYITNIKEIQKALIAEQRKRKIDAL